MVTQPLKLAKYLKLKTHKKANGSPSVNSAKTQVKLLKVHSKN